MMEQKIYEHHPESGPEGMHIEKLVMLLGYNLSRTGHDITIFFVSFVYMTYMTYRAEISYKTSASYESSRKIDVHPLKQRTQIWTHVTLQQLPLGSKSHGHSAAKKKTPY